VSRPQPSPWSAARPTSPTANIRLAITSALAGEPRPERGNPKSTYVAYFAQGIDPVRNSDRPGVLGISVDRHTGRALQTSGLTHRPLRQTLWEDWTTGAHFGYFIGWIPRGIWLVFGIAPLLLAVTGTSTWLSKRGQRKRSRRRATAAAAAP